MKECSKCNSSVRRMGARVNVEQFGLTRHAQWVFSVDHPRSG
jgi:hypothetical protein